MSDPVDDAAAEPSSPPTGVLPPGATLQAPNGSELPVGTVLAFAGRYPKDHESAGWYLCDGRSVPTTGEFAELFGAIGYTFGRASRDQFHLPDLRGWFVRFTASDAGVRDERDPDWRDRRLPPSPTRPPQAAALAGAVGTRQLYATARPRQAFETSVDRLHITKETDDTGCADRPGVYDNNVFSITAVGGDRETRPRNKYVWYLIKVRGSTESRPAAMPVGVLVPYAGQRGATLPVPAPPVWRVCHGGSLDTLEAAELFAAVDFSHGRAGEAKFVLPDYRGWFHRGVDGGSRADPDAERRTSPYGDRTTPEDWRGNSGDAVGSAQEYATGLPTTNPFLTEVHHLPVWDASKRVAGILWNLLRMSGGSRLVELSAAKGDAESRPINVSVDWYVMSSVRRDPDPLLPVGAVAMMASTLVPNEWWLPCDGRRLASSTYGDLYRAIGTTYGGDGTGFRLPDYRGRFLRGASYTSGVDPDTSTRVALGPDPSGVGTVQDWATGRPGLPFMGNIPHFPETDLGAHGVTNDGNACNSGTLTFPTCTGGGDSETRPRNVYLNCYIRAR